MSVIINIDNIPTMNLELRTETDKTDINKKNRNYDPPDGISVGLFTNQVKQTEFFPNHDKNHFIFL